MALSGKTTEVKRTSATLAMLLGMVMLVMLCQFLPVISSPAWQTPTPLSDRQAGDKSKLPITAEMREHIRQAIAAVGLVRVRNTGESGEPRPRGSAVIVRKDGIVVTNYHVINKDSYDHLYPELYFELFSENNPAPTQRYRMKAVLINKDKDLVLLRIISSADGKLLPETIELPTITLGNSYHLELLDDLVIIGFPEKGGSTVTVNTGIIEGKDILGDWLKTDARLIHGNSGGAAVDRQGHLVGIPTKVVVDSQEVDTNKDGFPDTVRTYGAVGFLRPVHLVSSMLDQLHALEMVAQPTQDSSKPPSEVPTQPTVTVRGMIKSKSQGNPIAGALIGLILLGSDEVTPQNLLTWGGSDPEGRFELNKPVPSGSYTLKVKAIGYEPYNREVEIKSNTPALMIELQPLR